MTDKDVSSCYPWSVSRLSSSKEVRSSIPIVDFESESEEILKLAKERIAYAIKDLNYGAEMIYCEKSEDEYENEERVRRSYSRQHPVQSAIPHKITQQRYHLYYWLIRANRVQLVGLVKFIKFEYVFKRIFEAMGLYEYAEKYKTVYGNIIGEVYDKIISDALVLNKTMAARLSLKSTS
ncbi:hypothetical protein CHS0354_008832 [Potamilus streckersoni]|uniref:Uncharacterized protein n=1 Tax=Potamilus streckersoni TaxID=2493646 RepID=A0AAE0SPG6_9BIVA|nr:hypothetical protein CHS0354_008832 [Potamilus streckersoni]